MDLIDKKILCELDINCRQPYSVLAKKLRISRNVVDYRIKNLEATGVIKGYICSINLGLIGYKIYKIYLKIKHDKILEKSLVEYCMTSKEVIHLLKTEGSFDYSVTVAIKDIAELDSFLMRIKNKFKGLINDYNISIVVYSKIFKLNRLLLGQNNDGLKLEKHSSQTLTASLDQTDKLILKVLSQDANTKITEIAKKTRLTLDIVKYRLKTLSKELVHSHRIILDLNKLGLYHYIVFLKIRKANKAEEEKLVYWCSKNKKVMFCTKRVGVFDFEINAAIKNIEELTSFLDELKDEFSEIIDSYEVGINTNLLKLNYFPE